MSEIVNRVSASQIISINLEEIYPQEDRVIFDLKPFLWQELILKEQDFRQSLKQVDWEIYRNKWVAIQCSVDAIVPTWAFMLVCTYLDPVSKGYSVGDLSILEIMISESVITKFDIESFRDRPIVIKGCSKFPIPLFAYGRMISLLQPVAKSLMFGEPCSTVPLFKKGKS
ncbi:Protein of unknown function [Algoriphagus alkaliphilus]|uniref:DUF2480 family protein n=1 Tax=Algoriphagus alkaliphilus TaxID=279824 RepID=A0A1G5XQN1_9BACT|nr:DUF2480 family protein [Algoriphagus alkaliphilus]MBA4301911.1 DUF2480 domain-containing protein [Cyclobacterium sp.]SDA72771.1 Protein of unknown function [Algoriphagus alkaliphilus]